MTEPKTSVIVRAAHATVYGPSNLLTHLLGHLEREYRIGETGQLEAKQTIRSFFERDLAGRLQITLGLVPAVAEALKAAGLTPKIFRLARCPADLVRDHVAMAALGQPWSGMAEALEHQIGTIHLPGGSVVGDALATICRTFPKPRILILAARAGQVRWLSRQLKDRLKEPVCRGLRRNGATGRILISTFRFPYRASDFGVVVVPYASDLDGIRGWEVLKQSFSGYQRRYAFVIQGSPMSIRGRQTTEAYFGPEIWSLGENKPAPVQVLVCDPREYRAPAAGAGIDYKRKAVWGHDTRNRDIAKAALAILAGEMKALWELGLLLHRTSLPAAVTRWERRVAVLVESTEHGRRLVALSPGWPLLQLMDAEPMDWPVGVLGAVVTMSWAKAVGLDADVLIRADAGPAMQLKELIPSRSMPAIVVDFNDPGPDQRRFRDRINGYLRAGWQVQATEIQAKKYLPNLEDLGRLRRTKTPARINIFKASQIELRQRLRKFYSERSNDSSDPTFRTVSKEVINPKTGNKRRP